MEWTYCLECGAPQFPGDAACPECTAASDSGEAAAPEVDASPTQAWVAVLRSIWIAQLLAAAGGLLLALVVGIGLGYASRMMYRPVAAESAEPVAPAATRVVSATAARQPAVAAPAVAAPPVSKPVPPSEPEAASPADRHARKKEPAELMGPPRPFVGPPFVVDNGAWELGGVRPPPEYWLQMRFPERRASAPVPMYEPLAPSLLLYGRQMPGPASVEVQWQFSTPPEWQGAVVSPPME